MNTNTKTIDDFSKIRTLCNKVISICSKEEKEEKIQEKLASLVRPKLVKEQVSNEFDIQMIASALYHFVIFTNENKALFEMLVAQSDIALTSFLVTVMANYLKSLEVDEAHLLKLLTAFCGNAVFVKEIFETMAAMDSIMGKTTKAEPKNQKMSSDKEKLLPKAALKLGSLLGTVVNISDLNENAIKKLVEERDISMFVAGCFNLIEETVTGFEWQQMSNIGEIVDSIDKEKIEIKGILKKVPNLLSSVLDAFKGSVFQAAEASKGSLVTIEEKQSIQ